MSGQHQIPKAVLSSPLQDEQEDDLSALRKAAMMHETVTINVFLASQDMHQNRIKMLRKELEYLKETEWKYENIDKFIGQK